jgi:predicted dehydrogenase
MNLGIVGTGYVAAAHIAALKKIDGINIRAISGRNTERATQLAADSKATVYADWRAMLDRESLDAVFILLPPHLHGDLEFACAARVKGVLIEKPICTDLRTAQTCNDAFRRAGTIVSVGYMNRYRESVRQARQRLTQSGSPIVLLNGWWIGGVPGPIWWRTFDQSGGQFVEQCTHLVDLARYLAGEIVEVSAYATRGFITDLPGYTIDDAMVVNVRFASGAVGNFTNACHRIGHGDVGLKVSTRHVQCDLTGWEMNLEMRGAKSPAEHYRSQEDIFETQDRLFLQAVRKNDPSLIRSTYPDAILTLQVTLAANESAKTGRPVELTR